MTRFLSQSLQAPEPGFRTGLQRLEASNNHPNTDIRFTTEVQRETQTKLQQLGLGLGMKFDSGLVDLPMAGENGDGNEDARAALDFLS